MNYKNIHDSIINRAKIRKYDGPGEKHHIVPRSMGGSNKKENIVLLTFKEHYLIHILLTKIYPDNNKLLTAAWMMSNRNPSRSSIVYAKIRLEYQNLCKEKAALNIKNDPEYYRKFATNQKGKKVENTENYRGPKAESVKNNMSKSAHKRPKIECEVCGKIVQDRNFTNHMAIHNGGGKKPTDEHKNKISDSVKNIPRIPCNLCTMTINPGNMWRHMKKHDKETKNYLQCI